MDEAPINPLSHMDQPGDGQIGIIVDGNSLRPQPFPGGYGCWWR